METEAVRLIAIACALIGAIGLLYGACYAVAGFFVRSGRNG